RDCTGRESVRERQRPRCGCGYFSQQPHGDLFISLVNPPQNDIQISSRYGNVSVELPSNSAFSIDARTEFGEIRSEFQGLNMATSNRERYLTGRVGTGGAQIMIAVGNGSIHLGRKG